ncbi:pol, partial [Symbiodinium microadriaticum]
EVALDPAFDRLLCLIGKPRKQGVLATFTCLGEGHWTTSPLSAKIVVDESKKARTLCFVGDLHREQCVVLELLTQHLVLTKWDHLASKVRVKVDPKSFAYPMEVSADDLRREQLAVQARDAPMVLAADGLLERDVSLKTGQTVTVPVVEARAVKCGAETCWQEVSVDCEGPNRE